MKQLSMIRLSAGWSSGAVLQHNTPQQLHGNAAPKQRLHIILQCQHQCYQLNTHADELGVFSVEIAAQPPSGPWTLCISDEASNSIRLDDLWFGLRLICAGQSNIGWPLRHYPAQLADIREQLFASSTQPLVRAYLTDAYDPVQPADYRNAGSWQALTAEQCADWPALLCHFSQSYQPSDTTPLMLGLVDISWPGSAIDAWTEASVPASSAWQPGALFAARLAPWLQQPFAALLWYQGEQDAMGKEAVCYADKLQHWLFSCRRYAGWDFPLLLVQIAGFGKPGLPDLQHGFVQVRQAQQQFAASTPNCVLVSAADLGAVQDIHPPLKAELARRLALQLHAMMQPDDSSTLLPLQAKLHQLTTAVAVLRLPDGVHWPLIQPIEGFFADCPATGWQAVPARYTADQQRIEITLPPAAQTLCYGMAAQPALTLYNADGLPLLPGIWPLQSS